LFFSLPAPLFLFFMSLSRHGHHSLTDSPEKGCQLSGDGDDNGLFGLASGQEAAITGTKPELRFPGNLSDAFRQALLALEQGPGNSSS
jgi:hypothetical protein